MQSPTRHAAPQRPPNAGRVLLLFRDLLYADGVQRAVMEASPAANVLVTGSTAEADSWILGNGCGLLVTLADNGSDDVFEFLRRCAAGRCTPTRIFVITSRDEPQVLATLSQLGVAAVYDPSREPPHRLVDVIRSVLSGDIYWSSNLLYKALPKKDGVGAMYERLTPHERLVLAVLGDGCDDTAAAAQLQQRVSTVRSVRRDLHAKLGVRHKGELVWIAIRLGFVLPVAHQVVRPGYALLLAATQRRAAGR